MLEYVVLDKSIHRVKLREVLAGRKFDWIYIDTCNSLNFDILTWLCRLDPTEVFTEDAGLYLAFCSYKRGGYWLYESLCAAMSGRLLAVDPIVVAGNPIAPDGSRTTTRGYVFRAI